MGCCHNNSLPHDQITLKLVFDCIENNRKKYLTRLFTPTGSSPNPRLLFLNNERAIYNTLTVNTLGFSLIQGNHEAFAFFHSLGCEILHMEKLFNQQNLTSLEIICLQGHHKLLSYYLPFYKEYQKKHPKKELNSDFKLALQFKPYPMHRFTPVQLATLQNHIQIITVLYQNVKDKGDVFEDIDLESKECVSGFNCALISVYSGNFSMVKYLYSNYNCDFTVVDAAGNTALDIAVIENHRRPQKDYVKILQFLIETVGIEDKWGWFDGNLGDQGVKEMVEMTYWNEYSGKKDALVCMRNSGKTENYVESWRSVSIEKESCDLSKSQPACPKLF